MTNQSNRLKLSVLGLSVGKLKSAVFAGLCLGLTATGVAAESLVSESAELYAAAHVQQAKPILVMVGTIDENGFPQIRVMSNLRNPAHSASKLAEADDFTAYAITNADTEKLKHLAKNPTMTMYYQEGVQGLLLMGKTEVLTDAVTRRAVWDDEFRRLGYSGPDDPKLVVLRFTPERGKFYYQGKQNHLTFPAKVGTNANTIASERDAIEKTIATYVEGHRQGKSEIMKTAFHPSALVFLGPKSDPAQLLFDMTDQMPPATEIRYEITSIEFSETISMVRVELFNCYGYRYTDMFTLVKGGDGWKITCKISYRHPEKI